jgi:hypothetical protein
VRVGDIRGKWKLFSSEHIDLYTKQPGQDIDDDDWESGVGTVAFGKHLIDDGLDEMFGGGDMGMVLDIIGGPVEAHGVY